MKVLRGSSSNPEQPLTTPFPVAGSKWWNKYLFWEFRGGDYLHPRGSGDWFNPPYFPDGVDYKYFYEPTKLFVSWKIPFLNWQGYFGAKAYGVDSIAYKEGICKDFPREVYDGSYAFMTSIRPFASIKN